MGYTKKALEGFGWLSTLKIGTKALAVGRIIILARLLSPRDFGVFGITTAVLALVERLSETGINTFLIQRGSQYEKYVNTAWVVSIIRGLLITALLFGTAFFLPTFYKEPRLFIMLCLAATIPWIKGFINPAIIKYWNALRYANEVVIRGILAFIETIGAIFLALWLRSAEALVLALIISAVAEVIISHIFVTPKPKFLIQMARLKDILRASGWLNIGGLLVFLVNNLDDLIIGKLLGTQALGYYQTTFRVAQSSVGEFGDLSAQTVFPIYTSIYQDRKRLRRAFFRSIVPLAFFLLIPMALLFAYPMFFVTLVLGKQWIPIVAILPWLLGSGFLQAINTVMYQLYLAIRKPSYNASILLFHFVAMIGLLIPLSQRYGLVGAGMAIFVSYVLIQPLHLFFTYHTLSHA